MITEVPRELKEDLQKSRLRLRDKKPKAYRKLINYLKAEERGDQLAMSLIDLTLSFKCNFRCLHCSTRAFRPGPESKRQMTLDQIKRVADQADEAGVFVINLIGGEPLVWDDLDKAFEAIDVSRFHISMTTNGWFLTPEVAQKLAALGVDKIGVSIDSGFPEEHDLFREKEGSFDRAIKAVKNAKDAGIRVIISTVVTHKSIYTPGFKRLLDISVEMDVGLDLQCATVSGGWRRKTDILIDADDAVYLKNLRKKYPLLRRDLWSALGSDGGCPALKRSVYIIPSGEVLPCLFIHISLGNVFKEPLRNILKRGLQVNEIRQFTDMCLAGEDRQFIEKYLYPTFLSERLPLSFEEGFMRS